MQSLPMIAVRNVPASVAWYRRLLSCDGDDISDEFARLRSGERILLLVHDRAADEHGAWEREPGAHVGTGFVLWLIVEDFDGIYERARRVHAQILVEPHENPEDHVREFTVRDPDGYAVSIIENSSRP